MYIQYVYLTHLIKCENIFMRIRYNNIQRII